MQVITTSISSTMATLSLEVRSLLRRGTRVMSLLATSSGVTWESRRISIVSINEYSHQVNIQVVFRCYFKPKMNILLLYER